MPVRLWREFSEHDVRTVRYMNWLGKSNGELLELARDEFDAMVTCDQNVPFQQNITERDVAVVVIAARSNDIEDLAPLIPLALSVLPTLRRGQVVRVSESDVEDY